jgi:hypothetical protein
MRRRISQSLKVSSGRFDLVGILESLVDTPENSFRDSKRLVTTLLRLTTFPQYTTPGSSSKMRRMVRSRNDHMVATSSTV